MRNVDYNSLPCSLRNVSLRKSIGLLVRSGQTRSLLRSEALAFSSLNGLDLGNAVLAMSAGVLPRQVESPALMYAQNGIWTVFDFAHDSPNWAQRYRRLYNAVLAFVRSGLCSFGDIRDRLNYVLVMPSIPTKIRQHETDPQGSLALMHMRYGAMGALVKPWEYDRKRIVSQSGSKFPPKVDHDMRRLSGFLVRKAYYVMPSELDGYAQSQHWSN